MEKVEPTRPRPRTNLQVCLRKALLKIIYNEAGTAPYLCRGYVFIWRWSSLQLPMQQQRQEIILKPVSSLSRSHPLGARPRSCIGLFSLTLLLTLLFGVYQWFTALSFYLQQHPITNLDHYEFAQLIELQNNVSFQQTILKYKVYLTFTCGFVEPNIILTLCILLTFPLVICSVEKQNATSVAFYEYNGISMYLQLLRLGLDGMQYLLTGRCFCLNSGAGAVWLNMLVKMGYHRFGYFSSRPLLVLPMMVTFIFGVSMVFFKSRVDLFLGIVVAVVQVSYLRGGTVKYPKEVFQQKQSWADWLKMSRVPVWFPFIWNDYKENHLMCLDSQQFYLFKEERLAMVHR